MTDLEEIPPADPMRGRRVASYDADHEAGAYWQRDGHWFGMTPNGLCANLANHRVVEHEDGTITVSPSILVRSAEGGWHGFLERGLWRGC